MFKFPFKLQCAGGHSEGVVHWWRQRLTAIALIPLVIWFAVYAGLLVQGGDLLSNEYFILTSKTSVIFFGLLLIVGLYHGSLGVKVVIEDYVHDKFSKLSLIIFVNLFGCLTAILLFFSLLQVFFKI